MASIRAHEFVSPIALGSGDRLFADTLTSFEVRGSDVYDNGVVHLGLVPKASRRDPGMTVE